MEKQQDAMNAEGAGPNMGTEAGGQESAENKPPTAENTVLDDLKSKVILEHGAKSKEAVAVRRILTKINKQS